MAIRLPSSPNCFGCSLLLFRMSNLAVLSSLLPYIVFTTGKVVRTDRHALGFGTRVLLFTNI